MMGNGTMDGGNMMMGWGGMFFGPLTMIAFLTLIIVAIVMLVKWMSGSGPSNYSFDEPLNILKIDLHPMILIKSNTKIPSVSCGFNR